MKSSYLYITTFKIGINNFAWAIFKNTQICVTEKKTFQHFIREDVDLTFKAIFWVQLT